MSGCRWFLEVYPSLPASLGIIEAVQRPGEVIFVPKGWWHCVLNLDFSIALTQNFLPHDSIEEAVQDAVHDCVRPLTLPAACSCASVNLPCVP